MRKWQQQPRQLCGYPEKTGNAELPEIKKRTKHSHLPLVALLLLMTLSITGCNLAGLISVPNLLGLSQDEAESTIRDSGLAVGLATEAYSDTIPAGHVINQIPPADTSVALGTEIVLLISLGLQYATVPDLLNRTPQEAIAAITEAGFTVGEITTIYSDDAEENRVLAQNPAPDTNATPGSRINFTVSLGALQVLVPTLVGLDVEGAETAIANADLTLGTITEVSSMSIPENEVIAQNPAAGVVLNRGDSVNLVVSSGLPERPLQIPASVIVGNQVRWGASLTPLESMRSTVYNADGEIVYARAYEDTDFVWTPYQPGEYRVHVELMGDTGPLAQGNAVLSVRPRGSFVSGTSHPLVAFYTFDIPEGMQGKVEYTCASCPASTKARTFTTPPIEGDGREVGALLPCLRPNSGYTVRHLIFDGNTLIEQSPAVAHNTGAIPISLPTVEVLTPPLNPTINALLELTPNNIGEALPQIVDEKGTPVWYHPKLILPMSPMGYGWAVLDYDDKNLQIIDYTGQALRHIAYAEIDRQLLVKGLPPQLKYHHEVRPLPGNRLATLGHYERLVQDLQGPGLVDVVPDMIVVLDDQMQVVWTWDAAEHLDLSRMAVIGIRMLDGVGGINLQLANIANDWTHSNTIEYDPSDGNLLLSIRHQNWVVKIAYENGQGDGHVIWKLGEGGDFDIISDDPNPWFSFQHDPNILPDGRLAIYDNGNYRVFRDGDGNSRGQIYRLNENTMTATLEVNIDLGVYSSALGSSNISPDGSFHFNSGKPPSGPALHDDIAADGTLHGSFATENTTIYRSFRMKDPFDTSAN